MNAGALLALLAPRSAADAGFLNVESDLHEFSIGGCTWGRAELLALPLSVRRQQLTWLRQHREALAEAHEQGLTVW